MALSPFLGGETAGNVVQFLSDRIIDSHSRLTRAMRIANERSWRAIEVALAGPTVWDRVKELVGSADDRAFRQQVQQFLAALPQSPPPADQPAFRAECLRELRRAREANLLPGEAAPAPDELAAQVKQLAGRAAPQQLLRAQLSAVDELADDIAHSGYPNLARFVKLRPAQGLPLLAVALRFFFRLEVENDPKLAAGLTYQQLEDLSAQQETGFRALHAALAKHGDRMEQMLAGVVGMVGATHQLAREVRDDVAELRQQNADLARQIQELTSAVMRSLAGQTAAAPPPPSAGDNDLADAEALVAFCHALPPSQRSHSPELEREVEQLKAAVTAYADVRRRLLRRVGPPSAIFRQAEASADEPPPSAPAPPAAAPAARKLRKSLPSDLFRSGSDGS